MKYDEAKVVFTVAALQGEHSDTIRQIILELIDNLGNRAQDDWFVGHRLLKPIWDALFRWDAYFDNNMSDDEL